MKPMRQPQQYEEIAEFLRQAIRSGQFEPGDPLPSEAELCERFTSSRGPVRQAMATLRSEGLISSGRGRRSIVLDASRTESFEAMISVTAWLTQLGYEPGQKTEWIARRPADATLAAALEIPEGDPVVSYHRVRFANGTPVMVERANFRLEPAGRLVLAFDTDSGSIHRHLMQQGVDFNNVTRTLLAVAATEEDAQYLGVEPGSPLQLMPMKVYDHSGTPLEYSYYLYRGDLLRLGMNTIRGNPSPLWVEIDL